jgi:phthalate 4,5-cis-dihydrodiol dehydrogenase
MSTRRLRMGVAGLGRAFTLMVPTLTADARIQLIAAADLRPEATRRFAADFGARTYASVDELCADPGVEVVFIATPHQCHALHVTTAAAHGKHVLVEKPMAVTVQECVSMIDAVERAGVQLIVGHSHSFDRPILRTREIIASGAVGAVRMINAQYYTDYLYRPRRPEELDTPSGGGAVFSQGAHQIDIVRLLGGGYVRSVRAHTGAWDSARPTEGAYAALLTFDGGAFASLVYSGYAHFNGDEFCGDVDEMGKPGSDRRYGSARRILLRATDAATEVALKNARNYGGIEGSGTAAVAPGFEGGGGGEGPWHQHFGLVVVSCEHADLRPMPTGVMIYGDTGAHLDPLEKPQVPRVEVIDELHDAVDGTRPPLHDGRWAMATLEVVTAMLQSAREQREILLRHQVGVPS